MSNFIKTLGVIAVLGTLSTTANAENLLNTGFGGLQTFTAPGPLIVFKSGSFTQTYFTTKAETVMLSLSAVCATTGTGLEQTKITINLSGKSGGTAVYPTNQGSFALCSAIGGPLASDGRGNYSLVTGVEVNAGIHNLTVQVTPPAGGKSSIADLSIQVWN